MKVLAIYEVDSEELQTLIAAGHTGKLVAVLPSQQLTGAEFTVSPSHKILGNPQVVAASSVKRTRVIGVPAYRAKNNSKRAKILEFFKDNPTQTYRLTDLKKKFPQIKSKTISTSLVNLTREKALKRVSPGIFSVA